MCDLSSSVPLRVFLLHPPQVNSVVDKVTPTVVVVEEEEEDEATASLRGSRSGGGWWPWKAAAKPKPPPATTNTNGGTTKPLLLERVHESELNFQSYGALLRYLNKALASKQVVSADYVNYLRSPDLVLEVSSELVCTRGIPRQSLLSRRPLYGDQDIANVTNRLRQIWKATRKEEAGAKVSSKDSSSSSSRELGAQEVYHLPLPTLPLRLTDASTEPALSIYISSKDAPADEECTETLDPLSKAVINMQSSPRNLAFSEAAAQWLTRLDARALQRYAQELTDGLIGSIEDAFSSEGDNDLLL